MPSDDPPSSPSSPAPLPAAGKPRRERPQAPGFLTPEGRPIATADELCRLLGVPKGPLLHQLYRAPDEARYVSFEIPKRSGGMRRIDAPFGVMRDAQDALAPLLAAAHDPHPASHGFLPGRSVRTNAAEHAGQRLVLNVDLADFFPSINFGRVRGLFMAAPFNMSPAAAALCAQICAHRNGLPQGAPTSPALSNFIASALDRRLNRLARERRLKYSRYADDLTFSTKADRLPHDVAYLDGGADAGRDAPVRVGEALEKAIRQAGFEVNPKKVRLQSRHVRQEVTGLTVNAFPNVARKRVRKIRAMLHAWEKFGLEAAAREHVRRYASGAQPLWAEHGAETAFRAVLYGHLAFVKMVRGAEDPVFLGQCAKLAALDPTPSRFMRQIVFGADDFDVFICHASEDKEAVARPVAAALERAGLKAFVDEAHIAWGAAFTLKINAALGAAPVVLAIISNASLRKEWPMTELNTALSLEVAGRKKVVALLVGRPDLTPLPLVAGKDHLDWTGDADAVAAALQDAIAGRGRRRAGAPSAPAAPTDGAPRAPKAGLRQTAAATAPARDLEPTPPAATPPPDPAPPAPSSSQPPARPRGRWRLFGRRRQDRDRDRDGDGEAG